MNYQKIHDAIIDRARSCQRDPDEYYEHHHIIPSALDGPDDDWNRAYLTAREHFLVHWLLYKLNPCSENAFAWHMMSNSGNEYHTGRLRSSHYEYARKAFAKHIGDIHRGKPLSEEHRRKLSESKMGERNPMFGKAHPEEHKQKLSEMNLGEKNGFYGKTHTPEVRARISASAKLRVGEKANAFGMKHTEETKRHLSELVGGKPRAKPHEIVVCPHCGKEGIKPNMVRWHFEKCKERL